MKNKNPLQLIEIGSTHTLVASSKGKTFSFGWNNFGQCGVSPNCNLKFFSLLLINYFSYYL